MKKDNPNFETTAAKTFLSLVTALLTILSLVSGPVAAVASKTAASEKTKAADVLHAATVDPAPLIPLTVFSNATAISVPDNTAASAQSNITVSGLAGPISSLTVTLTGVNASGNAFMDDLDMLLVGPGGQKFLFLSDVGGFFQNSNGTINLTLSDAAAAFAPNTGQLSSGTYKPTNHEAAGDVFNPPAPAAPYLTAGPAGAGATFTSAFGGLSGASVNGVWSLFIEDDASSAGTQATISGGWSLDIVTTPAALATTTSIVSSANPSFRNQAVTFTSTTTSTSPVNTGVVNFVDTTTATTLCANVAVNASGVATCTAAANSLTERSHVIQATYVANATFSTSNSSLTQTVNCPVTQVGNTFTNGCGISIPDAGAATSIPYPSNIVVSGLSGSISKVTLTLTNVNFPSTNDHNFLLVGPNGDKYVFWSDVGGAVATTGQTITLDDAAASQLPNSGSVATGTYRPADYAVDSETWPAPAPAGPYPSAPPAGSATFASVFGGDNPLGTWSLYPTDDTGTANASSIGGWSLTFTTTGDAATTTVLTSSPNPSNVNQAVTFTATVTSGVTPVTVGTVTFRRGATILCSAVPLNGSGVATCSPAASTFNTEGSFVITADYNGSPGAFNISSGNVTQEVNSPTVVTCTNFANNGGITIPNSSVGNPYPSRIIVSALGGTISKVTLSMTGINAPNPDHADFLLVGPGGQKFLFMGDAGGTTAVSGVNITLDDAAATALPDNGPLVSGTFRPSSYTSDSDIFPAPAPAGPYNPAAPDGTGTFANVFNGISPNGTWSLYAVEDTGDALNTTLTGWSLTFTLAAAATTTTVTSNVDPSVFGQPVTFTATVSTAGMGTPTGSVQFLDGVTLVGGPVALNASGVATLTTSTLSVGNHAITASYGGASAACTGTFNASVGSLPTNPQTVNQASTTTGITSNQSNPVGTGVPVTFTATVSPVAPGAGTRTGSVTFFRDGDPVCPSRALNGSAQATCTITFTIAGNYNITAQYSGDTNFASSSSNTFVQQAVGPTAANTNVSGRVLDGDGRGVSGARVSMQSQAGEIVWAVTNPFGYYRFVNLAVGQSYIVTAEHKRYSFAPRTINLNDELTGLDFTPISGPIGSKDRAPVNRRSP
ncbi:MAG TPA: Ig-like domain repeat protein [Pyrinomonadaceae bacterium]|nr:Ig-like domain repeat protein [Pyrinomonadaceae bacterium]